MATLPAVLAFVAARPNGSIGTIFVLILSVLASASGAAALNQWTERFSDTRMNRTRLRPLPAGHLSAPTVLLLGLTLVGSGVLVLGIFFNAISALLALAAAVIYWLIYTPLKKVTPWCTEIGAVSGGLPPLIGWAAAEGELALMAWVFFAILFLWQMPHFHPIAWRYRHDYARARLRMRAVVEPTGNSAANASILYAILLVGATVIPFIIGESSLPSLAVTVSAGIVFLVHAIRFRIAAERDPAAWKLFRFSLIYLPIVLATLTLDSWLHG